MKTKINEYLKKSNDFKHDSRDYRDKALELGFNILLKNNENVIKKFNSAGYDDLHLDENNHLYVVVGRADDIDTSGLNDLDEDFITDAVEGFLLDCGFYSKGDKVVSCNGECIIVYRFENKNVHLSGCNIVDLPDNFTHEGIQDAIREITDDGHYPTVVELRDRYGDVTLFKNPYKKESKHETIN